MPTPMLISKPAATKIATAQAMVIPTKTGKSFKLVIHGKYGFELSVADAMMIEFMTYQ